MSHSSESLKRKLADRDGNHCHYCGVKFESNANRGFNPNGISIDHVVPISLGGGDELDNLVLCCRRCNRKKHATEYSEFCFAAWTDGMLLRLMNSDGLPIDYLGGDND